MLNEGEPKNLVDPMYMINGSYLSKEAQDALRNKLQKLPPAQPHHYAEARRRQMKTDSFVSERPKSMFLRKRRML